MGGRRRLDASHLQLDVHELIGGSACTGVAVDELPVTGFNTIGSPVPTFSNVEPSINPHGVQMAW